MPSLRLSRFGEPETLRSIEPALLVAFLAPHEGYLVQNGVDLQGGNLDYERLVALLMSPRADAPAALVDALYLVHECTSDDDADALLEAASKAGKTLSQGGRLTAADTAIRAWLLDPDLLRDRHAKAAALRQRHFIYFGGSLGHRDGVPTVTAEQRRSLEEVLDEWFDTHHRGRGCRVLSDTVGNKLHLIVRHGQRMVREASQDDEGAPAAAFYRPQKHDLLAYDPNEDVIAIHAGTKGEIGAFLESVGLVLFGDRNYFPHDSRFTLSPLVDHGPKSLACEDIDGLEQIRLVEVRRYWGGPHKELEIRKAQDIFAALKDRGATLEKGKLEAAVFKVKFSDSSKERSVAIRVASSAKYDRDADSELIEEWLRKRGFVIRSNLKADRVEAPAAAMALAG
ncbi:MAG: hypothetical protein AB7G07_06735 [Bauldia sp.]